ncbi:MAG TPA: mechanosensitive ion channel domain-containing protein [Candidatus Deferrimicrobium sp.]|nr:mechanosensitive ion channel domain-containing protein [Candidatus Deferrimicrobium sp.]
MGLTGILWIDILLLAVIVFGILIIYKIFTFLINRATRTGRIPIDIENGLKILIRLIVVIVIVILVMTYTQLPSEITLGISAIIGTMIGFASIQAVQNFISGVYIIITHPFGVNDLVAIGPFEGIVTEISLNYTKLITTSGRRMLISNRNVLNSVLVNFTKTGKITPEHEKSTLKLMKHIIAGKEITHYAFSLELLRDNPKKVKDALEQTAVEWESKLGYKPQYMLWGLTNFAIYRFVLSGDDPKAVIQARALFIKDLYQKAYAKN